MKKVSRDKIELTSEEREIDLTFLSDISLTDIQIVEQCDNPWDEEYAEEMEREGRF